MYFPASGVRVFPLAPLLVAFGISTSVGTGCQQPPSVALVLAPGEGVFLSSQIKPPPPSRPPLAPRPRDVARLARQREYFASRVAGRAADKAALLGASGVPLAAGVRDLAAGALPHVALRLAAGQEVLLETRALTVGADPVLHLYHREGAREVARDDDGGDEPGAARLRFQAAVTGTYIALLRPYADADDGRCDLLVDGAPLLRGATFGGTALVVAGGRTLHATLLNDGATGAPATRAASDTLLLHLDGASGALLALDDDGGVELGSRLAVPEGAPALALLGAYGPAEAGLARLVVNDAPQGDADGDGLGDGLEAALCLCARAGEVVCGFDCAAAATPEDTDGDGLSDGAEVLGVAHARFPQLLPRWGADPRHKDLFVEVDLADWVDRQVAPPVVHDGRAPSAAEARLAARVFARLTAQQNPDGQEGLRLHLDVGHPCGERASGIDDVCGALCAAGRDGVVRCGQSRYTSPAAERRDGLADGRRHLFHVAVADCVAAGSAPGEAADSLEYDCDRVTALVHELGHNLGLSNHYGEYTTGGGNCKPNYPSLMNYAFSDRFAGGAEVTFSTGALRGVGDLDPRDLDETRRFGGPDADVSWLAARPFYFPLHDCQAPGRGCKVDWNRDGRLDPSVRAHLSPMPNYGYICEGDHGNALGSENLEGLSVAGGPAAAESWRRGDGGVLARALVVFAPERVPGGARLQLSRTAQSTGGWAKWSPLAGPLLRADAQPAALARGGASRPEVWLFACVDGPEPIRYAILDEGGTLGPWRPLPGQPAGWRVRDVSVAARGVDLVLAARDETTDRVHLATHVLASDAWELASASVEGAALRSTVTPGLAVAADGRLYLAAGDPDPLPGSGGPPGRLHLYSAPVATPAALRDEELAGLRFADGPPTHQHELWSRPALAFVPHRDGQGRELTDGRGALALWWVRGTRTRFLTSWGRLDVAGADFVLGRWNHYEAHGYTDAVAGSSPALVLRSPGRLTALLAQSDFAPGRVRHVPFADGIPDGPLVLRDFDDRPVIREGLCRGLNWDCPERCQHLAGGCPADAARGTAPLRQVRCSLPRPWEER